MLLAPAAAAELNRRVRDVLPWKKGKFLCPKKRWHKPGFLVSPSQLKSWEIPFTTVCQEPGDIMLVGRAVLHAVVNTGPNIAAAINFASPGHKEDSVESTLCSCRDSKRIRVPVLICYRCPFTGCEREFSDNGSLLAHKRQHSAEEGGGRYPCPVCERTFATKQNVQRHRDREHTGSKRKRLEPAYQASDRRETDCPRCGLTMTRGGLRNHLNKNRCKK